MPEKQSVWVMNWVLWFLAGEAKCLEPISDSRPTPHQRALVDRSITIDDLNKLRIWVGCQPEVPEDRWFKDFGSFKIVGKGPNPLSFLDSKRVAYGEGIPDEDEGAAIAD